MQQDPPAGLATETNRAVWAHVEGTSAHSDIADLLTHAVKPLGDVQLFCPDWHAYRYVVASTNRIIFGFAIGMRTLVFRLDEKMKRRALMTGAVAYPSCGDQWVDVLHHQQDADWPAVDLRFWALKAYVHARETNQP